MKDKEIQEYIKDLQVLYKVYYQETKDMISRLIILESNLIRLNQLLMMIRKQLEAKNENKKKR